MPRVLVVDDTASIRFLIRTNLEICGFEVDEAANGSDCLSALWGDMPLPDAVTMDISMPLLDGVSTLQALRADPRTADLPVVMVTTRTHPTDIKRAMESGAQAYISKPFDPEHLVATIRSLL